MKIIVKRVEGYIFEGETPDGVVVTGQFDVTVRKNLECIVTEIFDVRVGGTAVEFLKPSQYNFPDLAYQIEMLGNMGDWVADHEAHLTDKAYEDHKDGDK